MNMWQQQQLSDSAEKLVIFFFLFFGFLCYVCVQTYCLNVLSVVSLCVL